MSFRLLQSHPAFGRHVCATTLTSFADFFMLIMMPWMALSVAGGGKSAVAVVMAIESFPRGLAIIYGGRLADKLGAKRLLIGARMALVVLFSCFAVLLANDWVNIYVLCLFALGFSLFSAAIAPATECIVPSIVEKEQLSAANSLIMSTIQLCQIIAPVAAASSIAFLETAGLGHQAQYLYPIVAAALMQLLAIGLIQKLPIANQQTAPVTGFVESVKTVWANDEVRNIILLLFLVCVFAVGPSSVAYPLIVVERFAAEVANYGQMFSVQAVGAILGYVLIARMKLTWQIVSKVCFFQLLIAASLFALALFYQKYLILMVVAMIGFADACIRVTVITHLQTTTERHILGMTLSMVMLSVVGAIPLSRALSAIVVEYYSVDVLLMGSGLLTAATIVTFYVSGRRKPQPQLQ
ncbi:MFS transporter [Photobacterium sp. TY1-4]|uniref:MFS transporter n=1 Tax=Photobacterium sp. TY1-4 TaxID=2899122 RepID=UPI0021C1645D|nr:MFS transporter [Photobacterium sp. TY1-4]UXI04561.1 MFS transporter [Photobacterium sp. TY1-4]